MKIDILCSDGSPLGVTPKTLIGDDPQQIGVGGAEYALLTMCEEWSKMGYKIRLYNNPRLSNELFEQLPITTFNPQESRDAVLIFRSPTIKAYNAKGKRIWWSTDPYTQGDFRTFAPIVHKIVTISPFHATNFEKIYGIKNTITIDLPVRTWEYEKQIDKIPHRCIFTSVPDRGLAEMMLCWPEIVRNVPDASLVVTSDYRLWGCGDRRNDHFLHYFVGRTDAKLLGAIKRPELVEEEMKAQLLVYPSTFLELFCIAVSEAMVAGAFPITSNSGALPTTNMGMVIDGDPKTPAWRAQFIDAVSNQLKDTGLKIKQDDVKKKAIERFSVERICNEWKEKIFI